MENKFLNSNDMPIIESGPAADNDIRELYRTESIVPEKPVTKDYNTYIGVVAITALIALSIGLIAIIRTLRK